LIDRTGRRNFGGLAGLKRGDEAEGASITVESSDYDVVFSFRYLVNRAAHAVERDGFACIGGQLFALPKAAECSEAGSGYEIWRPQLQSLDCHHSILLKQ
jgi:hypothetical protein